MRYHESWQARGKKAERWMWLVTTLEQTAPEILWEMMNRRWDIEENGFHQLKTYYHAKMKCLTSTEVPTAVDCGGCEYMNLDDTTENWADMLKLILEKNDKLKIDREKLYKFSDSYMAEQMEGIFENDSE